MIPAGVAFMRHKTFVRSQKTSQGSWVETEAGDLICTTCPSIQDRACVHIRNVMKAGEDNHIPALCKTVTVPIVSNPTLIVPVDLGDPDEYGMRTVNVGGSTQTLGYLAASDGRWAIRDLVVAWLVGEFRTRPSCANGCDRKFWGPMLPTGLADTYCLITQELCSQCLAKITSVDDDDLIPSP